MQAIVIVLGVLVSLIYLKWILISIIFPFQVIHGQIIKRWGNRKGTPLKYKLLKYPYKRWDELFHNGWTRYMLFQVGMIPSHHIRRFVYRALGAEVGENVVFHFRTEIRGIHFLHIGDGTIIGDNTLLDARRGLTIGKNVNFSSNVSVYTLQHDHRSSTFSCPSDGGKVTIGDRTWIGCNVIILPGVSIGEGAVCCAGCVVTKDVEPYSVVAGIPAKKVNERPSNLHYEFTGRAVRLY